MAVKNYDFKKILKEYNKIYGKTYELSPSISKVIIHYNNDANTFRVTYLKLSGIIPENQRDSLANFIYYSVSSYINMKSFKDIIQTKGKKKLNLQIKIWPSSKIRYAYLYTNYFSKDIGNLGKSCMRGKESQRSLNFYIKNKARIVVVIDEKSKIHARALLWNDVKDTHNKKGFTYLDRIYTNSESLSQLFYTLAEENKWKWYESTSVGKAKSSLYKDNLDINGMCHFPYTDTFRYLYFKDDIVASSSLLSKVKHTNTHVCLTTTSNEGYFSQLDPNKVEEALTGQHISKKDATFIKRYGGYVLKRNIADINGAYYSTHDNSIKKTEFDGYILKEDAVEEALTNETINKTIAVYSDRYKGYIHKSHAVIIGDRIYHKSDTNIVCFGCKWYHISQCFRNYNRKTVNEELAKLDNGFTSGLSIKLNLNYSLRESATPEPNLIPKEHAIIAYNLVYNPISDNIDYQEVYCTDKKGLVQLVTGELIVYSLANKKYLKRLNNKYYIKREFKLLDKKQLLLFT